MFHRKRKLFGRKKKGGGDGQVALQITSMADIFTILLVFLLKGLATDALQISPSSGTVLPNGIRTSPLNEVALQVEVSKDGILIEKEFLMPLNEGRLTHKDLGKDGFITVMNERLTKERDRQKLIAQANDTVKIDSRAIIMSDQSVPFATMKPVLRTLASQGYSEIKFAVVKEN
ncbi:MAG: biopolymer transporter ExbD [Bdellovibrionales bacterium]|nr:biopolymer transporter ExbD [Bdellovibrionales bacterium]